jgi:hypothetical protein
MKKLLLIAFLAVLFFEGCSPLRTEPYIAPQNNIIDKSLFNSPDRTISEVDIQKLLNGKLCIPDTIRIALFNYSAYSKGNIYRNRYYPFLNSEEFLKVQQDFIDTLIMSIRKSKKVHKVIIMPSIMANENSSITNLRELAVRLQADYLMVYAVKSSTYYRYNAFRADETKAFATCEMFLMDSKTGIIPYTTIMTKDKLGKQTPQDVLIPFEKRVESESIMLVLKAIGIEVSNFFDNNKYK